MKKYSQAGVWNSRWMTGCWGGAGGVERKKKSWCGGGAFLRSKKKPLSGAVTRYGDRERKGGKKKI